MHRIPSTEDKKRDRSLSVSLSSSSFVSPQRRQPKKKPMLDRRETLLGLSATPTAHPLFPPSIDATAEVPAMDNGYPETPEYFRQQRNKRIPTVPRVSPLHAKAMPSTTAPAPALKVDQQSFLQTRVHSLTQALIKSNQHHKRTQEHLTWALEEHALVQLEKQQLQAQLSYMKSLHNGDRAPPTSSLGNYDDDNNDVDMFLEGTSHTPTMSFTTVAHQLRQDNDALKAVFASHVAEMQHAMAQMSMSLQQQVEASQSRTRRLSHYDSDMAALQAKCAELMAERRHLHNTVQELRGNIRVFCRLRPLGTTMKATNGALASAIRVESETRVVVAQESAPSVATFDVDRVFDQHHTQHDVFLEVEPLITSALDGYNVCVLAYGQTGSGKTHTMLGNLNSDVNKGLCPRVFRQVFDQGQDNQSEVEMHLSVLQVYNEKVLDLVQPSPVPLDIRVDKKLGVTVPNRTWVAVSKVEECMLVMEKALRHRAVAANDLNDASSRSHCITSLKVRRTKPSSTHARHGDVVVVESKINLVDLAGSERLGSSNSEGERRSEAQHINKSLLALRHVLLQLKNKQDYVSYRDSKLTLLLQDAIGGHAKTLLFVCVNPAASCAHETKCSLAFGERANAVELGRAKQHVNTIHRGNSKNV
ncbi:hypothetical protein H310_02363 [Aphanomyces invadans]|uniref:Kinesin-like protein n=1 Tax=Aphanomyces invadans TaxID=157072 RepID=A0A024UNH5_9STRA|nr:hypothetical protein H310_02363 [Aphanomyces invadans]ETW07976.1 hypothetical protein H310_02363 [Aphanomyces invadans]|eukprot:XP_008864069.1 hypothetical protein H310_02363 [Aphanomyces invadans]